MLVARSTIGYLSNSWASCQVFRWHTQQHFCGNLTTKDATSPQTLSQTPL